MKQGVFWAILLAGAFLRFYALDRQSLWDDEMATVRTISLPSAKLLNRFQTYEVHPPLYFLQMKLWRSLHLRSLVKLRVNSSLWGTLSLVLIFWVGRRYGGVPVGLAAMAFLAFSPLHLAYSQEIRPYAMAIAISLAALGALERWLEKSKGLVALGFLWTAQLYTHYWGAFVVAAQFLYGLLRAPNREARKVLVMTAGTAGLLFLPWVPVLLTQITKVDGFAFWVPSFSAANLAKALVAYTGLFFNVGSWVFYLPTRLGVLIGLGLCFAFALGVGFRKGPLAVTLWLTVGLGVPWILSLWKSGIYVWYRYPIHMLPAFVILIAVGMLSIRPAALRVFIMAACIGSQVWGSWVYFTRFEKANPKAVVRYVHTLRQPNTLVIRPDYFGDLFNFYDQGTTPTIDQHLLDSDDRRLALKGRNVILVAFDVPSDPISAALLSQYQVVSARAFPGLGHLGITVYLLK